MSRKATLEAMRQKYLGKNGDDNATESQQNQEVPSPARSIWPEIGEKLKEAIKPSAANNNAATTATTTAAAWPETEAGGYKEVEPQIDPPGQNQGNEFSGAGVAPATTNAPAAAAVAEKRQISLSDLIAQKKPEPYAPAEPSREATLSVERTQLEEARQALQEARDTLVAEQQRSAELKARIDQLEKQTQAAALAEQRLSQVLPEVNRLQSENEILKEESKEVKAQLSVVRKELETERTYSDKLLTESDEMRGKMNQASARVVELEHTVSDTISLACMFLKAMQDKGIIFSKENIDILFEVLDVISSNSEE